MIWIRQMFSRSIELTHVKFMGVWTLDDHFFIEDILEFNFVQPIEVTFKGCIDKILHKKEERSPGILYG